MTEMTEGRGVMGWAASLAGQTGTAETARVQLERQERRVGALRKNWGDRTIVPHIYWTYIIPSARTVSVTKLHNKTV